MVREKKKIREISPKSKIDQQPVQAVLPGRLSLHMCLCCAPNRTEKETLSNVLCESLYEICLSFKTGSTKTTCPVPHFVDSLCWGNIRDQWIWQNFINLMCDKKFWMDIENLRSIYKKTVFRNFERFLPFLSFFSSPKSSLSLLREENFFSLNRSDGASKTPSFRTDFKNVHMTFVKSAPKKSFSQKTILAIEKKS